MKILVISGGNSSERKISFLSAKEVKKALETNMHKVRIFDLKKGINQLEKELAEYDLAFPVLHGEEGEGGWLQQRLSKIGKPFVGGNYRGYKTGWYKIPFKKFCKKEGIITAPWRVISKEEEIIHFGFPCVLKSSNGGSSKEVFILSTIKDLKNPTYKRLINSNLALMVEKYLPGTEVTVGILGNKALPIIEIVPPKGEWFNYKNKYSGITREIPDAPSLSEDIKKTVQDIALNIHQKLSLGPLSRIDFIVSNQVPHVLEVNTIPGFTSQSLFPKAAKKAGIVFEDLVHQIVKMSL